MSIDEALSKVWFVFTMHNLHYLIFWTDYIERRFRRSPRAKRIWPSASLLSSKTMEALFSDSVPAKVWFVAAKALGSVRLWEMHGGLETKTNNNEITNRVSLLCFILNTRSKMASHMFIAVLTFGRQDFSLARFICSSNVSYGSLTVLWFQRPQTMDRRLGRIIFYSNISVVGGLWIFMQMR